MVVDINEVQTGIFNQINVTKKVLEKINSFDNISSKYISYAKILDIPQFGEEISCLNCGIDFEQTKLVYLEHLKALKQYLNQLHTYSSSQELKNIVAKYLKYKSENENKIESLEKIDELIQNNLLEKQYVELLEKIALKNINSEVKKIFLELKIESLEKEKQTIQNVRISFVGRFIGKQKLRDLVLENINLQKQNLENEINSKVETYKEVLKLGNMYLENITSDNKSEKNILKINKILNNLDKFELYEQTKEDVPIKENNEVFSLIKYNDKDIRLKDKIKYFENTNFNLRKTVTKDRMKNITNLTRQKVSMYNLPVNQFFSYLNTI